jgi:hypothetical protein
MSNNSLALYTGYQYRVNVQGYEVIEVDMYITMNKVTRQQVRQTVAAAYVMSQKTFVHITRLRRVFTEDRVLF